MSPYLATISADGVVLFIAGMVINYLHFLGTAILLSTMATSIWVIAFVSDILLMHRLRRSLRQVKHDDRRNSGFTFPPDPYFRYFLNEIRSTIIIYLECDQITAEFTAETLDNMIPAKKWLRQHATDSLSSSSTFAMTVWEVFNMMAMQIQHNDPRQVQLVDLIIALSKRSVVSVETDIVSYLLLGGILKLLTCHEGRLRFWDTMAGYNFFIENFSHREFKFEPLVLAAQHPY